MESILIKIGIGLAVIASIAAWINTEKILRELSEIKSKLGIKEEMNNSIFDNDLDRD